MYKLTLDWYVIVTWVSDKAFLYLAEFMNELDAIEYVNTAVRSHPNIMKEGGCICIIQK